MPTLSPNNIWIPDSNTPLKPLANPFVQLASSVNDAITASVTNTPRPVANIAARNALFPNPVHGNRVWNIEKMREETYFGVLNASTNPKGKAVAGWYQTGGQPYDLTYNGGINGGAVISDTSTLGQAISVRGSQIFDIGVTVRIDGSINTATGDAGSYGGNLIFAAGGVSRGDRRVHNHGRPGNLPVAYQFVFDLPAGSYTNYGIYMRKDSSSLNYEIYDLHGIWSAGA